MVQVTTIFFFETNKRYNVPELLHCVCITLHCTGWARSHCTPTNTPPKFDLNHVRLGYMSNESICAS